MQTIIKEIKPKVDEVLTYSQHVEFCHTQKLLEDWYNAKKTIIKKVLAGQLIYECPEKITFELSQESKIDRYNSFIEYVGNLLDIDYNNDFMRYLERINPDWFYKNVLEADYVINEDKKIQKGTKVVKSFKYFITDPVLLADIQNRASNLIQENKVEGYLCLSVHPLDYLSSSENTFNWRSCHALDGEYRAGNLSYMLDESTIVCYLRSENEAVLPRFPESVPWNNKKWRCLLYFNNNLNAVFAGRQYPFFSPSALETVRKVLMRALQDSEPYATRMYSYDPERRWSHWHNDYLGNFQYSEYDAEDGGGIEDDKYLVMCAQVFNIYDIVKDGSNSRHFNDLLRSSCYTQPYYMFEKHYYSIQNTEFNIGKEVKCLRCGENIVQSGDTLMCPACTCQYGDNMDPEEYPICDCCGATFWAPEGWWIGDDYVCDSCYQTECFRCEHCGDSFFNSEKHFIEESSKFVCTSCYKDLTEE